MGGSRLIYSFVNSDSTRAVQVEAFLKANDADEKGLEGDAKAQANGKSPHPPLYLSR